MILHCIPYKTLSPLPTKMSGTCLDHAIINHSDNLAHPDLDSLELVPRGGATVMNHALTPSYKTQWPV